MPDTMKAIILELEQMPDEMLDMTCALEIMPGEELFPDVFNPCSMEARHWVLHEIIEKILYLGLFPQMVEAFKCLVDTMTEELTSENHVSLAHIRAGMLRIDTDEYRDMDEELIALMFGVYFMTLEPRKLVIAAIAAKRLSLMTPEACVGDTSSPLDGARLRPKYMEYPIRQSGQRPFGTVTVDIQKHGIDVEALKHAGLPGSLTVEEVNNCLYCGHFKCTEDCPPKGIDPNDGEESESMIHEASMDGE